MRAGRRRPIRRFLGILGTAAMASAMAGLGVPAAAADDAITLTNGTPIVEHSEGTPISNWVVAKFTDSGNITITGPSRQLSDCDTAAAARYTATIDWLGNGTDTTTGTVSCTDVLDQFQVKGSYTYRDSGPKDSGPFNIKVTVKDNTDQTTATGTTDTADITDATLGVDGDNRPSNEGPFVKVEGDSLEVQVAFFDNNQWFPEIEGLAFDPGITTSVNWGDGSAVQAVTPTNPPDACDCFGDLWVSATHVYDAPKVADTEYTITVTAKDDGGSTISDTLKAKISDAKLAAGAAKSFVAPAAQAASHVVASYTDAAGSQAAAADFTAAISWGDGASSAGTVTQTAAGAFDVSGTHTYSTAGTKSLTITVTDEEGQTLSMTATATVPALPTTGQPQTPVAPSMPLLPLVALVFGLAMAAGGTGLVVARRIRR